MRSGLLFYQRDFSGGLMSGGLQFIDTALGPNHSMQPTVPLRGPAADVER